LDENATIYAWSIPVTIHYKHNYSMIQLRSLPSKTYYDSMLFDPLYKVAKMHGCRIKYPMYMCMKKYNLIVTTV